MRYGLILSAAAIADQVAAARAADERGFHSVWTLEFFHQHGFVRLAAVAEATQRVQLGTAIAYAFMRAPLLAASAAMDLDEISGGRVILGLGSGTRNMNEKWYSVPFDEPPAPRMREAIGLVRAAFDAREGGGLHFSGDHYDVHILARAVPDQLVDAIAIAGRPDDVRDRLHQWAGLADHVLLYPPSVGVAAGRVRENLGAIIDTFEARS